MLLKIKEEINLEELGKYGFKQKYDVDTGEKQKLVAKLSDNLFVIIENKNRIINIHILNCKDDYMELINLIYKLTKADFIEEL